MAARLVTDRSVPRSWKIDDAAAALAAVLEWVGEASKYFGATMQLYWLRPADFDQVRQGSLPLGFETE
ncbi:hypothetical protein [Saccharopolyspora sp. SCSIO 74807]|uniref:hypothetical protein n=1 Tax=Saccharopolyspora sp. SCSIO 74807 TaxID=3118084 RepID=UPI0030D0DAD7